jgi:hypothetical protein
MSMDKCTICGNIFDTDYDPDCYEDVSVCICEYCREQYKAEQIVDTPSLL